MVFIEIDKSGIDECYQAGLVKPNEFRQIYTNLIEREIALRLESFTLKDKFNMLKSWWREENYILTYYQELSDSNEGLFECIMEIAASRPELLLLDEEDSKLIFLSSIFHKKSLLVRDCSDLLNHPLAISSKITVDKETLRAIDYLRKYVNGGKAVLKTLQEEN
nr:MAG TPA: ABC transporter [Caudoviricetes sp.]